MNFLKPILVFLPHILICSNTSYAYDPSSEIKWTTVKDYGGVTENNGSHYLDVIGHTDPKDPYCPRSLGMAFSQPSIRIHETQHMMHFQVRNLGGAFDDTIEGVYYEKGNGVVFKKPKTKVSDFAKTIPSILRNGPYQLYIIGQASKYPSLNNIGYLFNEWASYCSNIILNLQLEEEGKPEPDADGHAANYSPHFFGFISYGLHYLNKNEPRALNKQFKAAFALYAERTWQLMRDALTSPVFGNDNTNYGSPIRKLMDFYRSPQFEARDTLIAIYGEDWFTDLISDPK